MQNSDFRPDMKASCDVLVIGCGYVGRSLTRRLIEKGLRVAVTTRSRALPAGLPGCLHLQLDLADTSSIEVFARDFAAANPSWVFVLGPPGSCPEQTLCAGPDRLLRLLPFAAAERIVVASSTAVYGHTADARVSAETPAQPDSERARWLLRGEETWCRHPRVRILRLAGLYGPGRLIGEAELRRGAVLAGDPERWLNLIHVADAADLLTALARAPAAAGRPPAAAARSRSPHGAACQAAAPAPASAAAPSAPWRHRAGLAG